MPRSLPLGLALMVLTLHVLAAQDPAPADSGRVLIYEHRFVEGLAERAEVKLERRVMYWAEVSGPGMPAFQPADNRGFSALVVPTAEPADDRPRWFEVHVGKTGPHLIRITGLPPGSEPTLRVYRDDIETRRSAEAHDRDFAVGLSLGAGAHTGYRLDPTGGADPGGGSDVEGSVVAESGNWFGAAIGVSRQSFPDAGYSVTWFFIEPKARLLTRQLFGRRRTDIGVSIRFADAYETGPRHISPYQIGGGIFVTQHLSADGRRRGLSVYTALLHGRLGNVPETERRTTDRVTAGVTWVP
jgi:hypothetical protein